MPGVRQRLRQQTDDEDDFGPEVPQNPDDKAFRSYATGGRTRSKAIGEFATSLYLIGRLSAPELQEGAAAAACASSEDDVVNNLAKAGASGEIRGNVHRDVMKKLGKRCRKPPLYGAKVTLWDEDRHQQVEDLVYFALPHETADDQVRQTAVAEWVGFENNANMEGTFEDWKARVGMHAATPNAAAFGLWGDSASYNTRESLFVLLFNFLSGRHRTRYWICAFGKKFVQVRLHGSPYSGLHMVGDCVVFRRSPERAVPCSAPRWRCVHQQQLDWRQHSSEMGKCSAQACYRGRVCPETRGLVLDENRYRHDRLEGRRSAKTLLLEMPRERHNFTFLRFQYGCQLEINTRHDCRIHECEV